MTRLRMILVAASLAAAAGLAAPASAAMTSPLPGLKLLADSQGSAVQPVFWRRDCWWSNGRRHCRWVWVRRHHRWW